MTQKQTIIGLTPSFDNGVLIPAMPSMYEHLAKGKPSPDRIYVRRDYLAAIREAGAVPLLIHPEMPIEEIMSLCDGLIISGGADIDPAFYNEAQHEKVIWIEPRERFEWERQLIEACDEYGRPILGVCYGMQRLNVHYGGTLVQDIASQVEDAAEHNLVMHDVAFDDDFLGLERGQHSVNARHRQAVGVLADGFTARATMSDGIIEAFEGNGHYGVQWHPESDDTASKIYGAFVELCRPEGETVLEQQFAPLT